ncbi:MAG: DUF465 domain-containing protein [Pseudomonadota bacterium]
MSIDARLTSLDQRHKELETRIEEEMRRPLADDVHVHSLKRKKLAIKDQIVELEGQRRVG